LIGLSPVVRYGKIGATAEEIEEATKSAQMHDRIMSFPDGELYPAMRHLLT
jgi:ABC-type multidrug transport system fused ATPase/permease subunit